MDNSLRGAAAIVGAGVYGLGETAGQTAVEIMARAALTALSDAGLDPSDVDGVISASPVYNMASITADEYLGIRPRFTESTMLGGSSSVFHVNMQPVPRVRRNSS